jgi:hypothetical protein
MMVAMAVAEVVGMEEDVAVAGEEAMEEVVDGVEEEEDMEGRTMATEVVDISLKKYQPLIYKVHQE